LRTLVCIKRVPETGARITLTADEQEIDTSFLGFTISPHEECAVEEAVRIGGETTVLTLGPRVAEEQLRNALAMGIQAAILLESDVRDWSAEATAAAIADVARGRAFDLLLFGNEAADTGDYQVAVRVAHALGLPCVTGVKGIELKDGSAVARREASGGSEVFELPLPAVVSVKEGLNLPRYPSLHGRLKAKNVPIETVAVSPRPSRLEKVRLVVPQEAPSSVEILGTGAEAAPRVVRLLCDLGVVAS
jgi:electron transfer flavoprotein beta subunit